MDILSKHTQQSSYCDTIKPSTYLQKADKQHVDKYPSLIELFFSKFDHHYILIENKDKELYIQQTIMKIATEIDEDKINKYDRFNYLKCMNPSLIQQGLQSMNSVSALLYLSDYYNVSTNVYINSTNVKIVTSDKVRTPFHIIYTKDCKWSEIDVKSDVLQDIQDIQGTFDDLAICLTLDVKTKDIYTKYLQPISKYKSTELIDIAKGMNLSLDNHGKKKVKKELYNDINIYQLNLR